MLAWIRIDSSFAHGRPVVGRFRSARAVIKGSGTARLAAGSQLDAGASGRLALGISAVRRGVGTTRIAKELGIHHDTVRGVLETERMCPRPSPTRPSILDP